MGSDPLDGHGLTGRAFAEYSERSSLLDGAEDEKQAWFDALVASEYVAVLPASRAARILEIGCSRGYMMKALQNCGFTRLEGIDLSPGDVRIAKRRTGIETIECANALEFLGERPEQYDVILFKAVLEHVPRDQVASLLEVVGEALSPGGSVICEVPNMDWYAASHERYMDITHEAGYTRESLGQLFGLFFDDVDVRPVLDPAHGALAPRSRLIARAVLLPLLRWLLNLVGEQTADMWFEHRSIMVRAHRPRSWPDGALLRAGG